jgi:enoyl-CoA hydratase/carnithine racemase
MADTPLRVERSDSGVVVLTLDLPGRRNAMTAELTSAWGAAVSALQLDRSVRCVVVTGAGSAFCSGGDLSWISESPDLTVGELRDRMLPFYRTWLSVRSLDVPVLAAVNGPAIGAGLCLALACDLRYAAASARFGAPFTALGMHPGMAATYLLPEAVGLPATRELLYTGRIVDAAEAVTLGLAQRTYADEVLLPSVLEIAETVARQAPVAVRLTKAALATRHASIDQALDWEGLAQPVTMASADLREGLAAQAEKRRPHFTGR